MKALEPPGPADSSSTYSTSKAIRPFEIVGAPGEARPRGPVIPTAPAGPFGTAVASARVEVPKPGLPPRGSPVRRGARRSRARSSSTRSRGLIRRARPSFALISSIASGSELPRIDGCTRKVRPWLWSRSDLHAHLQRRSNTISEWCHSMSLRRLPLVGQPGFDRAGYVH